jgi:hypothetical protein
MTDTTPRSARPATAAGPRVTHAMEDYLKASTGWPTPARP